MPLVMMCGLPCSGKTRRAKELLDYIKAHHGTEVHLIQDSFQVSKNNCFASSNEEKIVRGDIKSNTERLLTTESIVILDSLNYIKGFRYELFCISKHVKTPHCVIVCEAPVETIQEWNKTRGTEEKYSDEILKALVMRFEAPDSRNRWDCPLFTIYADDPLPSQQILDALLKRKPPPPNQSTQSQPLSATDFLHELDRKTQAIVTSIIEAQRTAVPGDMVTLPGASEKICLPRSIPMAELRRIRRQFIAYTKLHPVEDNERIPTLFVQYLNKTI